MSKVNKTSANPDPTSTLSREDWIILRILLRIAEHDRHFAVRDATLTRALVDLLKRRGKRAVHAAIPMIRGEAK